MPETMPQAAREAWIVATARTPIGRANKGSLVECRPDDLSATIVQAVLDKVPALDPGEVEDILWGCAQPAGEAGYNLARVVGILAGLPQAGGVTVNRYCSSSLQTIRMAAHAIRAGEGDIFVAGGSENVSRFAGGISDGAPGSHNVRFEDAQARTSERASGGGGPWKPPTGLSDVYVAMGQTAENVAEYEHVTRDEQDEFAALSQNRAVEAQKNGFFEREITPVPLANGTEVSIDDGPRPDTTVEKLSQLQPVFRPNGTVTAGNACPLNDGAAAVVVMSDAKVEELGITPLARVVASAVSAVDPEIMGLGPIEASRRALDRAGMTIDDIDLVEINEAFAAQVVPSAKHLGIPWEKLNVNGGAIALGHPFGMTGARIMTTLLNGLEDRGGRYGLETMCVGGGQGLAMIVERVLSRVPRKGRQVRYGVTMFATDLGWRIDEFAPEVEARGFASLYIPEHTHIPTSRRTPPPTGEAVLAEPYKRMLDPFVALASAASVTQRLRLGTGIALLAQREPIVTAKAIATLDYLSDGRVDLGIGFGWNVDEMEHHGIDPARRRDRTREHVLALRALWTDDEAAFHGEFVDFSPSWQWPKPVQPGGPPVLMGGAPGPRLFAAVAEYCDGWMPIGGAGVREALPALRDACERFDRDPATVRLVPFGTLYDAGKIDYYASLGVEEIVLRVPEGTRDPVLAELDRLAELVAAGK